MPLASGFEDDGDALPIRTPARVLGATLKAGESVSYRFEEGRKGYLVPATGAIDVAGRRINARDGVAISDVRDLEVKALEHSEIVLVDAA